MNRQMSHYTQFFFKASLISWLVKDATVIYMDQLGPDATMSTQQSVFVMWQCGFLWFLSIRFEALQVPKPACLLAELSKNLQHV